MARRAHCLVCVSLVALGHAYRRVIRSIHEEALDLSFVEVDGRSWKNDFEDEYWILRVPDGKVSMQPQPGSSLGESIGTPYDDRRVFNLYGAWSDADVVEPSSYIDVDHLFTTLQLFGAEYYHMHVETLPKLVLAKKMLDADPEIKVLMYRPREYAQRFLQLLEIPGSSILAAVSNPAKHGDTACGSDHLCVDYRATHLQHGQKAPL